jgi:two-component system, sensor histidine kinase ChiS
LILKNSTIFPRDLLKNVETALQPLAAKKDIQLALELDAGMPGFVNGDEDRLNQILFNLVGNAVKFTEQGTISVRLRKADEQHWIIEVQDTGIGMPSNVQDRIFEAFWQVDGSSGRAAATGVGLGLSIVKQLVTVMRGEIKVRSTLGKGSVFTVTLPIDMTQKEAAPDGETVGAHH